ncbi:unnamed protein product [Didymodactylos carnosus]|uniref:Uncharacterized protein n=1 Tax=Didymodactylos carnosus TaxID=1234261 RepID=A0A815KHV6_9BILA|nr:unnamed protein product [Didymodactylos carnosus]CAF4290028.1 unnamed protein product [Didymodactylos carnosus]
MRSLTLNLDNFHDIFTLIQHVPNLIYLNIRSEMLDKEFEEYPWNSIGEIKLKEFHLAFKPRRNSGYPPISLTTGLDGLFHAIQIFSSSLITLSLDFSNIYLTNRNSILTNGMELEKKLLKPMQKLQNFYFYVCIFQCKDVQQILSTFATFPWPIGLHGNAHIYSLPFSFHELKDFHHFRDVRSNNDEFLKQNDRLWSKVTSLNLISIDRIDFKHLFPLIKQNMPKLSSIAFHGGFCFHRFSFPDESGDLYDKIERVNKVQLDSITTVCLDHISMKQTEQIPMYSFPNIQCLLLNNTELPLKENQLTSFLGEKLQRIEFDEYSTRKNLQKQNLCYLSNIKHLKLAFGFLYYGKGLDSQPEITRNLLIKLPKLETVSIYVPRNGAYDEYGADPIYRPIMARLNENEIKAQYKIRYSGGAYTWIIKRAISSSSSFEDHYYSEFCISNDENDLH